MLDKETCLLGCPAQSGHCSGIMYPMQPHTKGSLWGDEEDMFGVVPSDYRGGEGIRRCLSAAYV